MFVSRPEPAPDLLFAGERCLMQSCWRDAESWYMHTSNGLTAADGSGYRKLIRLCPEHDIRTALPPGMVRMDVAEVRAIWEAHGQFEGRLTLARGQGFCVLERRYEAAHVLRESWEGDCGKRGRTAVFVVEESNDWWRVEWRPAVQTADVRTLDGGSHLDRDVRAFVDKAYQRLAADRPWGSGKMMMDEKGFRTPGFQGFQRAGEFASRVVRLEDDLRSPEQLTVDMVSDY